MRMPSRLIKTQNLDALRPIKCQDKEQIYSLVSTI